MSSLATILLAFTVHLLGGHGEAGPASCLSAHAESTSAWMSHEAHIVACDATALVAEHVHDSIVGVELKDELTQETDSSGLESDPLLDPSLSGTRAVRAPPAPSDTRSTGRRSSSRHAPRGPPTP